MKVDILILFESKKRELESACLLKAALEKRNYKVVVRSIYPNKEQYVFEYNTKLVITPWAYNEHDMKYFNSFYIHKNTKILNLHHEQYSGEDSKNACLPEGSAKNVYHISWGNKFTKQLREIGCKENMICQSGNIRLDFLKEKFYDLSKTKQQLANEFNIDSSKKWVLFIANGYHLANETEMNKMLSIDKKASIKAEISKKTRLNFLEYVDNYLKDNEDTIFIYRPHPVYSYLDIKQEEIINLSNKYNGRFVCIYAYSMYNWIINSDYILSFHSTAGVECFAANKKYILFRPIECPKDIDYEFYYDYPYIINDYKSFYDYIKGKKDKDSFKNVFKEYFDVNSNEYSYVKICDFVDYIMQDNTEYENNKPKFKNVIYVLGKFVYKIFVNIVSFFNKGIFTNSKDSRYMHIIKNDEDFVSQKEINDLTEKIKNCLD